MKNIIILLFILIFANQVFPEEEKGIQFENGTWSEILSKAAKENKLVFLDAFASWCGPCKWMAKNVFTNDSAAEFYNKYFINAQIDMEKGEGVEIAKKYGIRAYPTFLYVNSNGELIHRTCGSCPVKNFIQNGRDALNPETQLAAIKARFEGNTNNSDLAIKYFSVMESGCMQFDSELSKYFNTQKKSDLTSAVNWEIINRFLTDYNSDAFKYLISHKKDFINLYSEKDVNEKVYNVYAASLNQLIRSKNSNEYEKLKKEILQSGISNTDEMISKADLIFYQRNKEWKQYLETAEKLANTYCKDDFNVLNNISWTIFENFNDKSSLLKAEKWAKHSVVLRDMYFNNDTYANILFKLGKKKEAKITAEKAIDLAKKEKADYQETQDLLNKINGQ